MCVVAVTGHIKHVIVHKHLHNIRNTIPITVLGTMIYVNVDVKDFDSRNIWWPKRISGSLLMLFLQHLLMNHS